MYTIKLVRASTREEIKMELQKQKEMKYGKLGRTTYPLFSMEEVDLTTMFGSTA